MSIIANSASKTLARLTQEDLKNIYEATQLWEMLTEDYNMPDAIFAKEDAFLLMELLYLSIQSSKENIKNRLQVYKDTVKTV